MAHSGVRRASAAASSARLCARSSSLPGAPGLAAKPVPMSVELRRRIFRHYADTGAPPELAADELATLAREHAVVLDRDGGIAFANPFATPPAPYAVVTPTRVRFAACVWDGLGVAAALGEDARVESRCPDCQDQLCLEVRGGELVPTDTVVHFLVPAGRWYENLDHT